MRVAGPGGASAESPSTRLTFERLPSGFAPAASRRCNTLVTIFGLSVVGDLELDLVEQHAARSLGGTTYHVVVDLSDRPPATIPEPEPPSVRADLRDGEQGCGSGDGTDARRRFVGRLTGVVAGERQLVAHDHRTRRLGELHRPAVVRAVAKAGTGAGQPQVGGVEVHRVLIDLVDRDAPETMDELGRRRQSSAGVRRGA